MFRFLTRKGAVTASAVLCMSLFIGSLALHTGCATNNSDYKSPAPAISAFLACKDTSFTPPDPTKPDDPPKTGTTISITSGASVYLRGNFAVTGGSAVITPGNLPATTNVIIPTGPITTPTTYTLTVTNSAGVKTTSQVSIAIPGLADATLTTSADPATSLTIGTSGLTASVPAQAGCTYLWSLTGGTPVSGTKANTFSFTAGSTVSGTMTLTCVVTNAAGTPTTGTRSFTLKDTAPTSLTFNPASLSLLNTVPMAGSPLPTVVGTTMPALVAFSLTPTSDPLPNGLTLSPAGLISGTPNQSGALPQTYNIIVRATNTGGSVDGTLSITLQPAPAFSLTSPTAPGAPVGPGANVVLIWSVSPSVTSFTITPTVQPVAYVPPALSGTFNLAATAATQTYTMTVQPGDLTTTATVHVDASDITIGTFGPAVVPFGSASARLNWTITGGYPNIQFVQDPSSTKISGDLTGAARFFDVTSLLPGRQTYTLTAQNAVKTATKTGFVAQRDLYHVAGSYGSGTGTLDGDLDANGISTARFYRTQGLIVSEFPGDNGAIIAVDQSANTLRHIGATDRKVHTIAGMAGLQTADSTGSRTDVTKLRSPRQATIDSATGDIYVGGEGFSAGYYRFLRLTRTGYAAYTPGIFDVTLTGAPFFPNANAFAIYNGTLYFVDYTAKKFYSAPLATGVMTQVLDLSATGLNLSAGPSAMAKSMSTIAGNAYSYLYLTDTGGSAATLFSKVIRINLDLFNADGTAKATPAPTAALYGGIIGIGPTAAGFLDSLTATTGKLSYGQGITADAKGNVYIADRDNAAVRMIPASGTYAGALITVVGKGGGTAAPGYMNVAQILDGNLPTATNTNASLAYPYSVAVTPDGSTLYVGDAALNDTVNVQSVHKVTITNLSAGGFPQNGTTFTLDDPSKQAVVFAGGPRTNGLVDGVGAVAQFKFTSKTTSALVTGANLALLPNGSMSFVADTGNNLVRVVAKDGTVTTLSSTVGAIAFLSPKGIATQVDGTGALTALFVADTGTTKKIRRFTPDSGAATFTEDLAFALTGVFPAPASLNVQGMVVDGTILYFTDFTANNVYKVDLASANVSSILVTGGAGTPTGIAIQPGSAKTLWVAFTGTNQIRSYDMTGANPVTVGVVTAGFTDGAAATAAFKTPVGLSADSNGFVYVTDTGNNAIRAIDTANSNNVSTLLGTATSATAANFYGQRMGLLNSDRASGDPTNLTGGYVFAPQGMAINATGDLLLTSGNSIYLLVAPANK